MKHQSLTLAGLWLCMMLSSCTTEEQPAKATVDPYAHIQDASLRTILKRAIDQAGGYQKWSAIKEINYTKHNMLFLEDSAVEVDNIQRHQYVMQPDFEATITWAKDSVSHRIYYTPQRAQQFANDSLIANDPSETVMSAIYVLGMPFKLLDAGTHLEHTQTVVLESGKEADEIKATYDPTTYDNHSTQDVWYYYFDKYDGTFYGAMVYHPPTYAYIQNLAFEEHNGIKFHAHRKSYRSDSLRNIKFLRAEFWYSGYEVK